MNLRLTFGRGRACRVLFRRLRFHCQNGVPALRIGVPREKKNSDEYVEREEQRGRGARIRIERFEG